jgi:hypothetical protein
MSRRRVSGYEVSTLPFLNILFAMIGVFTLFLVCLIVARLIPAKATHAAPPSIQDLAMQGNNGGSGSDGAAAGEPRISDAEYRRDRAEIETLTAELLRSSNKYEALARLKADTEAAIQAKEDQVRLAGPDAEVVIGRPIGVPDKVCIVPDRRGTLNIPQKPVLVEVKAEGLAVHLDSGQQEYSAADLDRDGSPLFLFLAQIDAQRSAKYLLLLIHDNGGAATYRKLRKVLLEHFHETTETPLGGGRVLVLTKSRISVGVEPFSKEWLLTDSPPQKGE